MRMKKRVLRVFPHAERLVDKDHAHGGDNQQPEEDLYSDEDNECSTSIFSVDPPAATQGSLLPPPATHRPFLHFSTSVLQQPTSYRPRLLLAGPRGAGPSSHLAPALLHHLDKLPVHRLDLPTLYSVSVKTPEESCAQVFREARRSVPSVVFMPHFCEWWEAVSETVRGTFLTLLQDIPSFCPILLLATVETPYTQLSEEVGTHTHAHTRIHTCVRLSRVFLFSGLHLVIHAHRLSPAAPSHFLVVTFLFIYLFV